MPEPWDQPPLYFYGHGAAHKLGYLSQFYYVSFYAPSVTDPDESLQFFCAEQYMMYRKAHCFSDFETADKIMSKTAKDGPAEVKWLGRQVKGFDVEIWMQHREAAVEDGNWYKFTKSKKNHDLKAKLLATGNNELVEAAPGDRIWGIGYNEANAEANRSDWGLNLLGKALMRVRDRIRDAEATENDRTRGRHGNKTTLTESIETTAH